MNENKVLPSSISGTGADWTTYGPGTHCLPGTGTYKSVLTVDGVVIATATKEIKPVKWLYYVIVGVFLSFVLLMSGFFPLPPMTGLQFIWSILGVAFVTVFIGGFIDGLLGLLSPDDKDKP